jgi:hypothetical protein
MAGAIASFWQAIPWATNSQVLDFVKQSADRFSMPDAQYGYGIPNFQIALDLALLSVETVSKSKFSVYPNPAQKQVFVSFPASTVAVSIELYTILGQKVFAKSILNENESIAIESLDAGVYFYKLQSGTLVQTGKIIKE